MIGLHFNNAWKDFTEIVFFLGGFLPNHVADTALSRVIAIVPGLVVMSVDK